MNWKDVKKTLIGKGLPLLGGVIGGSAGERIGGGIAGILGCEATPEGIKTALQDPEKVLQLKKYEMDHKTELERIQLEDTIAFQKFVLDYEGKAKDVPQTIQIIRSLIRPLLTILITVAFVYGWMKPEVFKPEQMVVLKPALLIVLIFWFGDRALQKSGILDVFKKK